MHIQVNAGHLQTSDALIGHATDSIARALRLFADQITRIEVHLRDHNGPGKGGAADKHCTLEARLAGHKPIAVHQDSQDVYHAIDEAAAKMERAIRHKLERHQAHLSHD